MSGSDCGKDFCETEPSTDRRARVSAQLCIVSGFSCEGRLVTGAFSTSCPLRMTSDVFLRHSFHSSVVMRVKHVPLGSEECHCDYLGFVLLGRVMRGVDGVPVGLFLSGRFCGPVRVGYATCLPLQRFGGRRVIPAIGTSCLHGKGILRNCMRSRSTTFVKKMSKGTNLFSATHSITGICRLLVSKKICGKGHCLDERAYSLFLARASGVDEEKLKFSGPSIGGDIGDPYTRRTPRRIVKRANFAKAYT